MKASGVSPSSHSKSMMIRLYAANNDSYSAADMALNEDDKVVSPYVIATAISASRDWRTALSLLRKAIDLKVALSPPASFLQFLTPYLLFSSLQLPHLPSYSTPLKVADVVIYTAAAQQCARDGQYVRCFKIVDSMLGRGILLNKFTFSMVVHACLSYQDTGRGDAVPWLEKYLQLAYEKYPFLLTNAVCQKVVHDLVHSRQPAPEIALSLHLTVLSHCTCKPVGTASPLMCVALIFL